MNHDPAPVGVSEAVAYVRVSTNKQERGYSPQTQRDGIKAKAAQLGLTIVATISEHYSGDELDRDGLKRLYAYLGERQHTRPIRTVICYCLDRWARSTGVQLMAEYRVRLLGADVVYCQKEYSRDESGELLKMVDSWAAGVEKQKIIERTVRGKYGKALAGYVNVGDQAPYGFTYISEPHKGRLEIHEAEAGNVRIIYRWYVHGPDDTEADADHAAHRPLTVRGICELLLARGIKTRRGNDVWRPAMVHTILTSRVYVGEWTYGKTQTTGRDRVTVAVPAIIDATTFEAAQRRISHNRKYSPRNSKRLYLLSGRVVCGHCGTAMTARQGGHGGPRTYYRCNSHVNQIKSLVTCPNKYFRCEDVDNAAWSKLCAVLEHPDALTAGVRAMQSSDAADNRDHTARLERIERELSDVTAQDDRLLDQLTLGLFTVEQIKRQKAKLADRRAQLEADRETVRTHLRQVVGEDALAGFEATCAKLVALLPAATGPQRRAMFETFDLECELTTTSAGQQVAVSIAVGDRRVTL